MNQLLKNDQSSITRRLCFVIDSLNGGGAEMVVLRLLETINNRIDNAQAHLIVLSQRGDYQVAASPYIHILDFKSNKNLDNWINISKVQSALDKKLLALEADFGPISAVFSNLDICHRIVKGLLTKTPRYYVIHSSPVLELEIERQRGWLKYNRLKRRKLALKNEKLITVSDGVKSDFKLDWLPVESLETIYNPFNIEEINNLSNQDASELPQGEYILHVGRVCAAKRHDRLFEAFKALNSEHKLVLLTKSSRKLDKLIKKYGLEQRVIIAGFQDNPYIWMKHAELVVLSSDYEGLPNVLIEALLCQTPVVSTDCKHGPKEILAGFHPEWLSSDFSPASLSKLIEQVLEQAPQVELTQWPLYQKIDATYAANQYLQLLPKLPAIQ